MSITKNNGAIVPGARIGTITLGMSFSDVCDSLREYTVQKRANCIVVHGKNLSVWFNSPEGEASQILAHEGYNGKFCSQIGIGDTLSKVVQLTGKTYYEEYDVYKLSDIPGIGFELADADDWSPDTAPITSIFVFPI